MDEEGCKCMKIIGHLEAVKWLLWPRDYTPAPGHLALADWTRDPHIWLYYVESNEGLLADDNVLISTDTRYWSIHDVQRYFLGDMHCEQVLFTYQYPNLRMPTCLGSYFWRANTALKLSPKLYMKELHRSMEITLKKMENKQEQMDRLIVSDQLIKIDLLDMFKRKTYFRILLNILSFQDNLQLVSFENLGCLRLEGVRLIQQLACFNADTLKYLFLWRFVLPNENPILINYSYITDMTTDEDKNKLLKLLNGLEVPELKLTERCLDLVKEFQEKFGQEVELEENAQVESQVYKNPYKVDRALLEENDRKLRELLSESQRVKKKHVDSVIMTQPDPQRPWRTHSNKEKLLRIDSELKRHLEKSSQLIVPLAEGDMKDLVKECREETLVTPAVGADRLRDTVEAARKNLPNFQYRMVDNTTATTILPEAHAVVEANISTETNANQLSSSGQYIPRPDTRECFLRSLCELRNLRLLALEYAHIADRTGRALTCLLPLLKRPHFRLQLVCREDQIPDRADPALGIGGLDIPDTTWRGVNIACPDLYLFIAFFRVRDYDNMRRFLTPSMPIREIHLQLGIDLKLRQRQDSDISCFVRHIAYFYGNTLVTMSIHQWRFAVFPLRRVFELMPRLVRFFYIGRVEDEVDLERMLHIVACGVCDKLKQFRIQIQDEESKRVYWRDVVKHVYERYEDVMRLYDINFSMDIYKN